MTSDRFFRRGKQMDIEQTKHSNEQLCQLIQQGHTEYLFQLWQQCERFIRMLAEQYVRLYDRGQDLVDDCVQEAFISLQGIAQRYRADRGAQFLTFLKVSLHGTFRSVMLSGRGSAEKDPLNHCESLDKIMLNADGDEQRLIDTIVDENAENEIHNVADESYRKSENAFIRECIQLASEDKGKVILTEMLDSNVSYKDAIEKIFGHTALEDRALLEDLRKRKQTAILQIRDRTRAGKRKVLMRKYSLDENAYRNGLRGYSKSRFDERGFVSEVERLAIRSILEQEKSPSEDE